jgi:hypothetical protein
LGKFKIPGQLCRCCCAEVAAGKGAGVVTGGDGAHLAEV